ncbi:hypothetical protein SAMN04489712_111180 [Thermomonospora echinospora]|uniref:Uncharacterized protein n=1 Tax=Thermomonospora echinospora TaxID=1992 RepID=A0A1H6CU08_9ACTN|nr:hypothetical protein [Thermomonospora echinospora]SEG76571.1 hypothetical protein SAMN04489712_111180 [Thermomonospora echinospora]
MMKRLITVGLASIALGGALAAAPPAMAADRGGRNTAVPVIADRYARHHDCTTGGGHSRCYDGYPGGYSHAGGQGGYGGYGGYGRGYDGYGRHGSYGGHGHHGRSHRHPDSWHTYPGHWHWYRHHRSPWHSYHRHVHYDYR